MRALPEREITAEKGYHMEMGIPVTVLHLMRCAALIRTHTLIRLGYQ